MSIISKHQCVRSARKNQGLQGVFGIQSSVFLLRPAGYEGQIAMRLRRDKSPAGYVVTSRSDSRRDLQQAINIKFEFSGHPSETSTGH